MTDNYSGIEIAIVGYNGVFPGADDVSSFWNNLVNGRETISNLIMKNDDLQVHNTNLNYINRSGTLSEYNTFDADFFGISNSIAAVMNPQQRLLLQSCYHALEHAGYAVSKTQKNIGVYTSASKNSYCNYILKQDINNLDPANLFNYEILNDVNFTANRIAFTLGTKGPAINIQTACSSSLVTLHIACQGLLAGDCDVALAGAVSCMNINKQGYYYQEGMHLSNDGRCYPFDTRATGTVPGDGYISIVLKRLEDAINDNDTIHAVIKSTAVNNDGSCKMGFTATNAQAQSACMNAALTLADLSPDDLDYIETHGTGTLIGDEIEFNAIANVFSTPTRKQPCYLGALKANIGHLDTAAGFASIIKIILMLQYKTIPPQINFKQSKFNLIDTPFVFFKKKMLWKKKQNLRRTGINCLGIGGTNAFAIIEEYNAGNKISRLKQVYLCLSAKTFTALEKKQQLFTDYLHNTDFNDLENLEYTLHIGRENLPYRTILYVNAENKSLKFLTKNDIDIELLKAKLPFLSQIELKKQHEVCEKIHSQANYAPNELLAYLWLLNIEIDINNFFLTRKNKRIPLPLYPFAKISHWVEQKPETQISVDSNLEILINIWKQVLGLDEVNQTQNFFDYGGDSLLVIQLQTQINNRFFINLPLDWISKNSTIQMQLHAIENNSDKDEISDYNPIILLTKEKKDLTNLFFIHPGMHNAFAYRKLASYFFDEVNFYSLNSYNYFHTYKIKDIPTLAALYIEAIKQKQKNGPYYLGGWSLGGTISLEIAQQLQNNKEEVAAIYLLDTHNFSKQALYCFTELSSYFFKIFQDLSGIKFYNDLQQQHFLKLLEAETQMFGNYQTKKYAGKVILYKATQAFSYPIKMSNDEEQLLQNLQQEVISSFNGFENYISDMQCISIDNNHHQMLALETGKQIVTNIKKHIRVC